MSHEEWIGGLHAVEALLEHHPERIRTLWLDRDRRDRRIAAIDERAQAFGLSVQRVTRAALDRRSGDRVHQGVLAQCAAPPAAAAPPIDPLAVVAQHGAESLLLVLDSIQDPHNLGACLRTADAAGVHAVIIPRDRSAQLTPAARKVASGAAERLPLIPVTNLARTLAQLKQAGIWIYGTADTGADDLYATDLTGPAAVVMGSEGRGLRRLTAAHCDYRIRLPMRGTVSSLNVSVATGILLYELQRQRGAPPVTAPSPG